MGRVDHPEVWDMSGCPTGGVEGPTTCAGGVGSPPGGLRGVGWPNRRSERVREAHPKVQKGSGHTHGVPGGVGRPIRRSGKGRRPSWWDERCWKVLLQVWEGWGGPSKGEGEVGSLPRGLGEVELPNRRSRRGWKAHPEVW